MDVIGNSVRKTLLIGIGNKYRSDDGIGLIVADEMDKKQLPSLNIKKESGEGAALMETWQGFQNIVIVDAVSSGAMPGTIYTIQAHKEIVPKQFFHYSSHAFGIAEAIELARTMNTLPQKLIIYGIEGKEFSAGTTSSPAVLEAARKVIEHIESELKSV